jgi:hypothetical protein
MAALSVTLLTNQERERRMVELDTRAERIADHVQPLAGVHLWTVDWGAIKGLAGGMAPNPRWSASASRR